MMILYAGIKMNTCDRFHCYDWVICSWIINEFLKYQINIGCSCFNVFKRRPIIWVHWRSNFKIKHCLSRENRSWSLCKWGQFSYKSFIRSIYIHWLNIHFFWIFSWIINTVFCVQHSQMFLFLCCRKFTAGEQRCKSIQVLIYFRFDSSWSTSMAR
jgi:hypothetical protein